MRPVIVVGITVAAYFVAFAVLQPIVGDAVFALCVIPIVVAAWTFGFVRGLLTTAVLIAITLALMQTVGGQHGFRPSQIPRILVGLALGIAAGVAGDMTRRQHLLLMENARIAAELRASQQGLERAVEERTAELVRAHATLTAEMAARREAEARAATADRMAVVGMLTAGIGHEINNPLAVIVANLDFITESIEGEEDRRLAEAVDDALSAALRAAEIVQHMRVFIQSSATTEAADVKRVIDSTLRMVANEVRHRAKLELDVEETPRVQLATAQLGQVLLNLLVNATQALPLGSARENTIHVKAHALDTTKVRIEVSDTGHGIPPDVVTRIFDPFFTTKPIGQGTGLGLWVCHQIVTAAEGTITVESEPGTGTTFRIELPVATDFVEEEAMIGELPLLRRIRMLVIDDDPAVGRSIQRLIGDRHDTIVLDSAPRALAELEAGREFDVILCDLMMPTMNGMEFFARLQVVAPQYATRVIFMTGGAFSPQTHDFIHHPSRHLIEKPFAAAKLESVIREVIEPARHN